MIVPMKKTSLIIFKEDKRKALRTLQKHGLMMRSEEHTSESSH